MTSKIVSFERAAALIGDRATVTVSSSSGLACPDRMLAAIGARFAGEGRPRGLGLAGGGHAHQADDAQVGPVAAGRQQAHW